MTPACAFLHMDQWVSLIETSNAPVRVQRMALVGHAFRVQRQMCLMHPDTVLFHDLGHRGIHIVEEPPLIEIPIAAHIFDDIGKCYDLALQIGEDVPRNGRYMNKFTRTSTQPKRIQRTSRSRP